MAILLIAATEAEIFPLDIEKYHDVELLITGVGAVNTCYHLMNTLRSNKYDLLLQAGVAGSFKESLIPGTVVSVKQDCFGDLGFEENQMFVPISNTPFANADEFPYQNGWLYNLNNIAGTDNVEHVKAVTINKVTDSIIQKDQLLNHFAPDIETMEGAAFQYVAIQENIPFIQIRGVSNYVGDRNHSNWKMQEAIANLAVQVERIMVRNIKLADQ